MGGMTGALVCGMRTRARASKYKSLHESTITSVAFSPDGTAVASSSDDGTIIPWHVSQS